MARQTRNSVSSPPRSVRSVNRLGSQSSEESGALRGLALHLQWPWGRVVGILGSTCWDARISDGTASLRTSGDHSSETGQEANNALSEKSQHVLVEVRRPNLSASAAYAQSRFDHDLLLGPTLGRTHQHIGLTGSVGGRGLHFYGESVGNRVSNTDVSMGIATQVGLRARVGRLRLLIAGIRSGPICACRLLRRKECTGHRLACHNKAGSWRAGGLPGPSQFDSQTHRLGSASGRLTQSSFGPSKPRIRPDCRHWSFWTP